MMKRVAFGWTSLLLCALVGSVHGQQAEGFDAGRADLSTQGGQSRAEFERFDRFFQELYFDKGREKTDMGGTGFYPYSRIKRFWERRADHTGALNPQKRFDLYFEARARALANQGVVPTAQWQTMGPNNLDGLGGRMISYAFHPDNPDTIYAGSSSGGLWWTIDGAQSWAPLTDHLPSMSVSSVALNPFNPNEMLIGTGWPWGMSFTSQPGVGVLRSVDGGLTWNTTGFQYPLSAAVGTYDLVWDYGDSSRVYLSANNGLYRSLNGGQTWTLIRSGHCTSIVMHPTNRLKLYAAMRGDGIYRSTNGGITWTKLTIGLPVAADYHQTNIAICRDYPDVMFTVVTHPTTFGTRGIFKSSNGGDTWTAYANGPDVMCSNNGGTGCAGWLFGAISAAPSDTNVVLVAGVRAYRTWNGGNNWVWQDYLSNGTTGGNDGLTYVDTFQYGWHPNDDNVVFTFNDGGVFKSTNKGFSWDPVSNQLETGLIYRISSAQTNPDILVGGTQDHGIQKLDAAGGNTAWTRWTIGDGGPVNIDFTNENIIYGALNNGVHIKSFTGASSFESSPLQIMNGITESGRFIVPQEMDPTDPNTLWTAGLLSVFKTTNGGASWSNVLGVPNVATIAIDHVNPDIVYVHAYDNCCWQLWRTMNGGATWTQMTDASIPTWRVTDLETDPTQEGVVYATRTSAFAGGDHVKRSTDYGVTWTDITANLPDVPTDAIAISPHNPDHLYLGNDLGVWLSIDGGTSWNMWNDGMPAVYVSDIHYYEPAQTIRIATIGRGVWESPAYEAFVGVEPVGRPGEALTLSASPAPFHGSTTIRFRLPKAGAVKVQVFSASGQRVADLFEGYREAGEYTLRWDGANAHGLQVHPGVFFARVTLGQVSTAVRLVRI